MSQPRRPYVAIDIILAIGMIGFVVALIGSSVNFPSQSLRVAAAIAGSQKIARAIDSFRQDTGSLPRSLDELISKPADFTAWKGPYLKSTQLKDPWGTEYQYRSAGSTRRPFEVISLGSDRTAGGTGHARDLSNWDPAQ